MFKHIYICFIHIIINFNVFDLLKKDYIFTLPKIDIHARNISC